MFSGAKQKIESKRHSNKLFWKTDVYLKDFSWRYLQPAKEAVLFPVYLAKDAKFVNQALKINSGNKNTKKNLICFELSEKFFFSNYVPIYDRLKNEFDVYFVCPDRNFKNLKQYLIGQGISEYKILPAAAAFFVDWKIYINCWVPRYYPNITQKKNIIKIQIYHGLGIYNIRDDKKIQTNMDSYRRLKKFNIHFIIGPQYEETIKTLTGKNNIYKIGYPKLDKLFNNTQTEKSALEEIKFPNSKKIILYAPHHNPLLSFRKFGFEIIKEILEMDVNLIIKLHNVMQKDKSIINALAKIEKNEKRFHVARQEDSALYYPIADLVITDVGTSAAAEAALCSKPVLLINNEAWFDEYGRNTVEYELKNIFPAVNGPKEIKKAIIGCFANKNVKKNRDLIRQYFYNPGSAAKKAADTIKILADK